MNEALAGILFAFGSLMMLCEALGNQEEQRILRVVVGLLFFVGSCVWLWGR